MFRNWKAIHRYFDFKRGFLGALLLGGIVAWINRDAGFVPASTAALKQALYTLLFGGLIVRLCTYISKLPKRKILGLLGGTLLPTLVTSTAILMVHSLKGTPYPLLSTLPTLLLAPFGFLGISYWEIYRQTKEE